MVSVRTHTDLHCMCRDCTWWTDGANTDILDPVRALNEDSTRLIYTYMWVDNNGAHIFNSILGATILTLHSFNVIPQTPYSASRASYKY